MVLFYVFPWIMYNVSICLSNYLKFQLYFLKLLKSLFYQANKQKNDKCYWYSIFVENSYEYLELKLVKWHEPFFIFCLTSGRFSGSHNKVRTFIIRDAYENTPDNLGAIYIFDVRVQIWRKQQEKRRWENIRDYKVIHSKPKCNLSMVLASDSNILVLPTNIFLWLSFSLVYL